MLQPPHGFLHQVVVLQQGLQELVRVLYRFLLLLLAGLVDGPLLALAAAYRRFRPGPARYVVRRGSRASRRLVGRFGFQAEIFSDFMDQLFDR